MNNQRRKELKEIHTKVEAIRDQLSSLHDDVENLQGEEQDYFDNMPENMQGGEKGQAAEEAAGRIEDAMNAFDYLDFDEILTSLDTAAE